MKNLIFAFFVTVTMSKIQASSHFTEVYENQGSWQVDHFRAEENKLQDLVSSRTFIHESQARHHSSEILKRNHGERSPEPVSTEDVTAAPLWVVTQAWDKTWEDKYATWVEQNLTADFFVKNNIATDCADVMYSLRWIFSRIHGLPAFATLGGTGTIVTQDVYRTSWKDLPTHKDWNKDQRFLAALNWLLNAVYTGTLKKDAYPVSLNSETMKAGLIYLLGSHAEIISHISHNSGDVPISILSSSVPRAVRTLSGRVFMDKNSTPQEKGGFVRFLWPIKVSSGWKITSREKMPLYSLEQYRKDLCTNQKHFAFCIFEKIGFEYDPATIMRKLTANIEENLAFRNSVVTEGFKTCQSSDCTPGTDAWENWSTPSRDGRLNQLFENTQNLSQILNQEAIFKNWLRTFRPTDRPASFTLSEFKANLKAGLISSDPRDSLEARWGDHPEGVYESVNAKYRDGQISREEFLGFASECRSNPTLCRDTVSSLPELSTLDMDYYLRNLLSQWMQYCSTHSCPISKLEQAFQNIWLQSPAPWDSLAERTGQHKTLGSGHVVLAQDMEQVSSQYLILNKTRLYDFKEKKEIRSGAFGFDSESNTIIGIENSQATLYDSNLTPKKSMNLPNGNYQLENLGNGIFFAFTQGSGYIIDSRYWISSHALAFDKILIHPSERGSVVLMGPSSYLVSASGALSLGHYPGTIKKILPFNNQEVVVTLQDENELAVGFLSSNGFEELLRGESSEYFLSRINSNYIQIQEESSGRKLLPTLIYNSQKQLWRPFGYYSSSLSTGTDQRIVLEAYFNERFTYLFNQDKVTKLGFNFQGNDPIISAAGAWLSIESKNFSQIVDYQGKEISRSNVYLRGKCSSSIMNCDGSRTDLNFETFIRRGVDPDGYLNFTRFGFSSGHDIKDVAIYGIGIFSSERGTKDLVVRGGSAIGLTQGVSLWYPSN